MFCFNKKILQKFFKIRLQLRIKVFVFNIFLFMLFSFNVGRGFRIVKEFNFL